MGSPRHFPCRGARTVVSLPWGVGGRRHRSSEGPAYELMQTFVPHSGFESTGRALDIKRLGKQRVEVIQIIRALTRPSTPRPAGESRAPQSRRPELPRPPARASGTARSRTPAWPRRPGRPCPRVQSCGSPSRPGCPSPGRSLCASLRVSHHQAVPVRPLLIRHERESAGLVLLCKAPTPGTHFTASDLPGQAIPASTKSGYGPRASARRCCSRLPSCFRDHRPEPARSQAWCSPGSTTGRA